MIKESEKVTITRQLKERIQKIVEKKLGKLREKVKG